jgi:uncharacterized protein
MNSRRNRAWRFVHAEFDTKEGETGLCISATGGIEMVDEEAAVRQAILLLLSTRPGERVMRPEYGADLHRLVFSPNDNTTAGLAIHYVRSTLARWEPRIDIVHIDAGPNPDNNTRLDIVVEYRVRATQSVERLALSMNLAGESS